MYPIGQQVYSATLREKAGELRAIRSLDNYSKDLFLPLFIALPLTEKENRTLSVEDLIKREVGKVQHNWGSRTCLWDSQFLVIDENDAAKDSAWLGQLLNRFSLFRTRVVPVINLREKFHRASLLARFGQSTSSGVALRVQFDDIQEYELVASVLVNLDLTPEQVILILDLTDADLSATKAFARPLVGWIHEFRSRGNWAKIITSGASFPFKNPALPKNDAISPRLEWQLWKEAIEFDPSLRGFALFGDYGADNARFMFGSGGRPIPHLRYATETDWITVRGDGSYISMQNVCKRIADSSYFRGRNFSQGDEFIADCAARTADVSDPSAWRAANMNHHTTEAIVDLAKLYGLEVPIRRQAQPEQASLFSAK